VINKVEFNFSDDDLVRHRVFGNERKVVRISRTQYLLCWHLKDLEQQLDQIRTVEVMVVFLAEISLVPGLYSRND